MENIFNLTPFGGEDEDFKLKKNSQMPFRGKSSGNSKSSLAKSSRGAAKKQQQANPIEKLFNLGEMVQTQISSVMVADDVIKQLHEQSKTKVENINKELEFHQQVEQKVDELAIEKKEFLTKQFTLTKENEDLKIKFSQLLD